MGTIEKRMIILVIMNVASRYLFFTIKCEPMMNMNAYPFCNSTNTSANAFFFLINVPITAVYK